MYPRMKELREKAGLSQEGLTSYLRINLRKYKKYESGKKRTDFCRPVTAFFIL